MTISQWVLDKETDIRAEATAATSNSDQEALRLAILIAAETIESALDRQTVQLTTMATQQTTMATQQTTIATQQTTIAAQQTIIAAKQTAIETYQKKLKELGEDDGIHWRRPNEFTGGAATYRTSSGNGYENVISVENISETYTGNTGSNI